MDATPTRLQRALTWLEATPAEAAGLVVLLLGAVLATGLLVWQAFQRPEPVDQPPAAASETFEEPAGADEVGAPAGPGEPPADPDDDHPPSSGPLVVHVTGAVARPGVVTLEPGARVTDAIAAAGGASGDARLELLNLARPLEDGEHVHLPREGEELPANPPVAGAEGAEPSGRVDLNSATEAQLQTLPGIGPAKAAAIVRHREEHGPFGVPGDLRDVPGIGEATFQRLADLVTVS